MSNRLIRDDDEATPAARAEQTPPEPAAAPARAPKRSFSGGAYPGRRQVTAHIPKDLFLWLKSISAQTDTPMVAIFEEALTQYVSRFAAQRKFGAESR